MIEGSTAELHRSIPFMPSMRHLLVLLLLSAPALGAHGYMARAQAPSAPRTLPDSLTASNDFSVWGGGSFSSSTFIAKTESVALGLLGVTFARTFEASRTTTVAYTAELIPLALLAFPDLPVTMDNGRPPPSFRRTGSPAYGLGLTPIGFRLTTRPDHRLQPYLSGHIGFMYFPRPIPDTRGRRANFTGDLGLGLRFMLPSRNSLFIGYRFHHLSNGFQGDINPGFDSHLFYIGLSTFGR